MGMIKVTDAKGQEIYKINTDAQGKVTSVDPGAQHASAPVDAAKLSELLKGADVGTGNLPWELDQLLQKLAQINPLAESKDLGKDSLDVAKRAEALSAALKQLTVQLADAKAQTPPVAKEIQLIENAIKMAEAQLKQLFGQLKGVAGESNFPQQAKSIMAAMEAGHANLLATPTAGKAQVGQPQPGGQTAPQAGAAPAQTYPGAGKAQGFPGPGMPMDINQLLQSSMFQTMNLNSMDALGKTQMDQKKMMMLFMYFAMMAMSGDIGAMTAFMQFITVIITKDKSQQNINMANKLIELEDASRAANDVLLNTPSFDPNNQQVGSDFMKTMEKVKAEQGSIATSQKLIAQMMEEFAQVSEFLNNLQKSLLDVRGRIMSRSSNLNS